MDNSLFRMNGTFDTGNILDDFQHRVTGIMEKHGDENGFPRMSDYGLSREELDGYLFEKQAILDSGGTERGRYTLSGVIVILPVLAVALFPADKLPYGEYTVLPAVLVGIFLCLLVHAVRKRVMNMRISNLDKENMNVKRYVDAVLEYGQRQMFV